MTRWTADQAADWAARNPWGAGCNYVASSAVNTTEMWQASTYSAATHARELGWAGAAGLRSARVFLPYIVWADDPAGLRARFAEFLAQAAAAGLSVMPVLFDDCAFAKRAPTLGPQAPPVPGAMMTSWTASPGHELVRDRAAWPGGLCARPRGALLRRSSHPRLGPLQ